MKKVFLIFIAALLAVGCVFAVDNELATISKTSVSASFGVSDEVAQQVHKGTFGATRADNRGLALNVRADFGLEVAETTSDWFATMIVGVHTSKNAVVHAKTDVLALYKKTATVEGANVTHYLSFLLGGTKKFVKEKFNLYTTIGPEITFNLANGYVDFGPAGAVKMAFDVNNTWSLDFNMKGGYKLIKDSQFIWDWSEEDFNAAFTANQFTFGVTYTF